MALGKGLGSLIPQKKVTQNTTTSIDPIAQLSGGVIEVNPNSIVVNPHQPRQKFGSADLEDLINSIKVHGIIQPLIVTDKGSGAYELIAGERRLRASKNLGLNEVPVIIRAVKEQEKLEFALIENIQRKNLNSLEEAFAYKRLVDEFDLTQEDVSVRVGKSRSTIANTLRLLELPQEVQDAIMNEKISEGHARAIAALPSISAQLQLLKKIIQNKISVRDAEHEVRSAKRFKSKDFDPVVVEYEEKLREKFGTHVEIKKRGNKGEIKIKFSSIEDFKNIINNIL